MKSGIDKITLYLTNISKKETPQLRLNIMRNYEILYL